MQILSLIRLNYLLLPNWVGIFSVSIDFANFRILQFSYLFSWYRYLFHISVSQ